MAQAGQPAEAIPLYDQDIQLDPGKADGYRDRGIALSLAGDHESAIGTISEAIQLEPQIAETLAGAWDFGGIVARSSSAYASSSSKSAGTAGRFVGEDHGVTVFNPGSAGPRQSHLPIAFGVICALRRRPGDGTRAAERRNGG